MKNSNEKLRQKYAYNINDTNKTKKISMASGKDFLSLNGGFYDEIENNDISIKKKSNQLKKIKNDSLKEFVFTNVKIPDKWKTKLDYQNSVIKLLAKDNNFLSYVGQGGSGIKNETASTKMFTKESFASAGLKKNKAMSTCYSQVFPQINKSKLLLEDKKNINIEENKEEISIKENVDNSNINSVTKINFSKNKSKKEELSDKYVANLLEEFKQAYPIKLPKEEEDQFEKIQEKEKERENKMGKTNLLFSQTFNYNQLLQKNMKYNPLDNFHKIRMKRQRAFRQNIFNNLIPPKKNKENEIYNRNNTNILGKYKKIRTISKSTSFLNSGSDTFYRKVKITNPIIQKNLENINFYGPFYPYCPPCLNRNLEFYNNLDPDQCLKLIQYIKKIRKKNILNIKGNNSPSHNDKNNENNINEFKENDFSNSGDTNDKKDTIELGD